MAEERYCQNIFPQQIFPGTDYDLMVFLTVLLYFLMGIATLLFILYGKYKARRYNQQSKTILSATSSASPSPTSAPSELATSIIFPIYEYYLYFQAIISIYTGIIIAQIPIDPGDINSLKVALLYASVWALQHGVIEGLSIVLLQNGCGRYALRVSIQWSLLWCMISFFLYFIFFLGRDIAPVSRGLLDFLLLTYYSLLLFLPQKILFRRPAVIRYSKFWLAFRISGIVLHLGFLIPHLKSFCSCGYYFFRIILFCLFQPILSYNVMLMESQWWQGSSTGNGQTNPTFDQFSGSGGGPGGGGGWGGPSDDPNEPSTTEFSLSTAQTLAKVMDQLNHVEHVLFLNATAITYPTDTPLGSGSFSQVVKGFYQNTPVAVKTIYTNDLTIEVINKIAAETKILSLLKNSSHVVSIFGLILSPPSICIVLELCEYGSLDNILRGYEMKSTQFNPERGGNTTDDNNRTWSRLYSTTNKPIFIPPFTLTIPDILFLALGAAKGVHAIHSFSSFLCHRDIKSFNFLVDSNLVVKIADLELGDDRERRVSKGMTIVKGCLDKVKNTFESLLSGGGGGGGGGAGSGGGAGTRPSTSGSRLQDGFHVSALEEGLIPLHSLRNSETIPEEIVLSLDEIQYEKMVHPSMIQMQATWLAPEVMTSGIYTQAADIYSLALVFWEIRTKRYPYSHCRQFQTQIRRCVLSGYRESFPIIPESDLYREVLTEFDEIISICWSKSPNKRMKSDEIIERLEGLVKRSGVESLKLVNPHERKTFHSTDSMKKSQLNESNEMVSINASNNNVKDVSILHLYQMVESHGGDWILISSSAPYVVLYLTNSWKLFLFRSLSTSRRVQFEEMIRQHVPLGDLLSLLYELNSPPRTETTTSSRQQSFTDSITSFASSCLLSGYSHMILKAMHNSILNRDIVALHGYPLSSHSSSSQLPSSSPPISSPPSSPSPSPLKSSSTDPTNKSSFSVIAILFSHLTLPEVERLSEIDQFHYSPPLQLTHGD